MDGVCLDTEHGYWNPETLVDCIRVIRQAGKKPFVRMKVFDLDRCQLCVDNIVHGIIFSTVECGFKLESGWGFSAHNMWGEKFQYNIPIMIAQIETVKGLEYITNSKEMSFNYYMLGLYDLSKQVGKLGDLQDSKVIKLVDAFESCIPVEKRGVHLIRNIDNPKYKNYGLKAYSLDSTMILDAVRRLDDA
jgi:2-keto-3-deoxy-L-rhamnonate aldolase RhmA